MKPCLKTALERTPPHYLDYLFVDQSLHTSVQKLYWNEYHFGGLNYLPDMFEAFYMKKN